MNKEEKRKKRISSLINTSVSDCEISLHHESDPVVLCDLLIGCRDRKEVSREKAVRARISKLIKGKK